VCSLLSVESQLSVLLLQASLIAGSTASVYLVDRGLRLMRIPVSIHKARTSVAC
jgi:hypothetical protein